MASISCRHVKKVYPGNVTAVPDFSLEIADKEFIVFVGPSGCGKSTTLRMIAGLEEISGGEMYIGDRLVNDVAPKDRDIAMVFQNYALYPHMTVYENMAFRPEAAQDARRMRSTSACVRLPRSWTSSTCSTASRRLCPVVSVSVLPWAAPSCVTRRSSCSTNLFPTWTPSSRARCAPRSPSCIKKLADHLHLCYP